MTSLPKFLDDIPRIGADSFGGLTALIFRDHEMTFGELEIAVERAAAGLEALGVRTGDRVALLLPNCPPFVICYYAAVRIGATVVPSNPLLKPAELEYIWKDADVRVVVTVAQLIPGVEIVRNGFSGIHSVICVTPTDELPDKSITTRVTGFTSFTDMMTSGARSLAALVSAGNSPSARAAERKPAELNACAVIIYTSGTTGYPKGAMLSHRNLTRNVEQVQTALHFDSSDRLLTVIPLFHSFAGTVCMNVTLSVGAASVLLESFIPGRVFDAIEKHRVTIIPAVPAIFNGMLMHKAEREYDVTRLRMFVSGGAPLPELTLKGLEQRFNLPVLEGDGPTECGPVTSVNPYDGPRKVGSVGPALPGVEIRIVNEEDRDVAVNEIGEIVVRGDNVMLGYLNQPEATAEAMRGGWYHTGDLGKLDEDGYCFIVDRKKDMLLVGGLNVYPREIEEVLLLHPSVGDVAVIGLPDAVRGEEVTAVVVLRPETSLTAREVLAHCRERLANYKVPRRVLFRDTLPRGGTGKVVKRLLKKELEMELEMHQE